MPASDPVDLRGQIPRPLADVLDAVSGHKRISRFELALQILSAWADDKMAEVTAVCRVTGIDREER